MGKFLLGAPRFGAQPLPYGKFRRRRRIESLHERSEAVSSINGRGCAWLLRHQASFEVYSRRNAPMPKICK
jgi:hypothetical protein